MPEVENIHIMVSYAHPLDGCPLNAAPTCDLLSCQPAGQKKDYEDQGDNADGAE